MRDVIDQVRAANRGRDPVRLAMKYDRMSSDPFSFFRGSCHLYVADLPDHGCFVDAPSAWICGDLHLENFGSYRGDDGLSYFDLNDFDEGVLAPATWEVARFVTSLWLAATGLGLSPEQALALERRYLHAYLEALAEGKAMWVERERATGMVEELLRSARRAKSFMRKRTRKRGPKRRLRVDGRRGLPVEELEAQQVTGWLKRWAHGRDDADFFTVRDIAHRIAGNGSLGLRRYILLVEGRGTPDDNVLLDLKQADPSEWAVRATVTQPQWPSEAARVVGVQRMMQAVNPACLHPVTFDGTSWILRELQPHEDRLRLETWNGELARLESVLNTMGAATAWSQLRSSGRFGAPPADDLVALAFEPGWTGELIDWAVDYTGVVREDHATFAAWWTSRGGRV
ncbi:MAG: DUF2252 domain-containing protein [Deltaproteobacteria bacterium]|nr:MAG: DUF2252 domain-containing protein [Deltaproteobacteria bacterium]